MEINRALVQIPKENGIYHLKPLKLKGSHYCILPLVPEPTRTATEGIIFKGSPSTHEERCC